MGTTSRYLAASRLLAVIATIAFTGCSDRDHTDICIGPRCPPRGPFDHLLGGSGGEGGSGGAGSGGEAGSGGSSSDLDAGPDATDPDPTPDATPPDGGGGDDCSVAFVFSAPTGADAGGLQLGPEDDVDGTACGAEFTFSVSIASNASSINLFVNDSPLGVQSVLAPVTDLDVVLGNRGSTPNTLRVVAEMEDGDTCEALFPTEILVDCEGPSCSLAQPDPSPDGFLNASQDKAPLVADFQTDIVVASELEHAGETVRLEIDGDFLPDGLLGADGDGSSATFADVTLDEDLHSVQAECQDATGNVTLSPLAVWNVDITPCQLDINQIAGGADPVTPASDLDSNPANGIQVLVAGSVTGGDCDVLHVGECSGSAQTIELDEVLSGSNFSVTVTLPNATTTFSFCADVVDDAGNTSEQVSRDVDVRTNPPAVAIAAPDDEARINRLGGSGALGDEDTGTDSCETTISVHCTELGVAVTLLVDGAPSGTATCQPQGSLPSPFTGVATFDAVSLDSKNDGASTTLSAVQSAAGLPDGTAPQITVQADCEVPACSITEPDPDLDFLNALADSASGTPGFQISFLVESDADSQGEDVSITIDADSGTTLTETFDGSGEAVFSDVSLDEGLRSIEAECRDPAGNVASVVETWTVDTTPCGSTLVVAGGADPITTNHDLVAGGDLQVLAVGLASGGGCVSARVGLCGSLTSEFTALDDDEFSLGLTLPAADAPVSACVEVLDVAGNVGSFEALLNVHVTPPDISIDDPIDNAIFTSASTDCDQDTAGLQIAVSGITDAADGSSVSVTLGSATPAVAIVADGDWTACVPTLDGDNQTLTASVTDAVTELIGTDSITVSVDATPSGTIDPPQFTVTARRQGIGDLTWESVLDADGDPLEAYHLRCSRTNITDETSWNAATDITVPFLPAAVAGQEEVLELTDIRTGTSRFCVVRGEDDNGNLSTISAGLSGTVANPFLEQAYITLDAPGNAAAIVRVSVEPLGDINGDGIDDFAQSATQRGASLFFGDTGISATGTEAADVTLTFAGSTTNSVGFGSELAGLGDISGDGIADFAMGAPNVAGGGMVFVFFGRDSETPWPATLDVDGNSGNGCEASLCIVGSGLGGATNGLFGWDLHSVEFDGVAPNDLVIASRTAATNGQVFILLGGTNLTSQPGGNITLTNADPSTNAVTGYLASGNATNTNFGFSIGAAGNGQTNVIIGANLSTPALFLLPPLGVPVGSGLTDATASLQTIETGVLAEGTGTGNFAAALRSVGDYNGDTFADFAIGKDFSNEGTARMYLSSSSAGTYSSSSAVDFTDDIVTFEDNYASFIAAGSRLGLDENQDPIVRVLGDIDADGFAEFFLGSGTPITAPEGSRGSAQLFYGASGAVARVRSNADFTYTSDLTNGQVVPNFVGDINGDGFNDLAVLDGSLTDIDALFLLY